MGARGGPAAPAIWHLTRDGLPSACGAEGFVHCSYTPQLAGTIAVHFAGAPQLVLLRLDPGRLGARLVVEPSRDGAPFPHVYGEIEPADIAERVSLCRRLDGTFPLDGLQP